MQQSSVKCAAAAGFHINYAPKEQNIAVISTFQCEWFKYFFKRLKYEKYV